MRSTDSRLSGSEGAEKAWSTGASPAAGPAIAAILSLIVGWKTVTGLTEIELSSGHAAVVRYIWLDPGQPALSLQEVHRTLDSTLGEQTVSDILSDLQYLRLIQYTTTSIERLDDLILA